MDIFDPFASQPHYCKKCRKEVGLVIPAEKACSCDPFESIRGLLDGIHESFKQLEQRQHYLDTTFSAGYGPVVGGIQTYG